MDDGLEVPPFLRGTAPGPKPRPLKWTRLRAERPEGAKWEAAERWQVCIPDTKEASCGDIPPGYRRVWVIYHDGLKYAELRDAEAYAKIPAAAWARIANKGRKVS